jgi:hypothetical protein
MTAMPGIAGNLLPSRFLAGSSELLKLQPTAGLLTDARTRQLRRWWAGVDATCGPATGLRALFDLVAMPLFGMLGFRARDADFGRTEARARLTLPGGVTVALLLHAWAERPPSVWRDVADTSHDLGAEWCFLLAPPHLSLIDVRGHALRRSVDFTFPEVLEPGSISRFWLLSSAHAFTRVPGGAAGDSPLAAVVAAGIGFQDRVRVDLQHGVVDALGAIAAALAQMRRPRAPAVVVDESLTLIYRVLFLLFAESRDLVPRHHPVYGSAYSVLTLCRQALRGSGGAGFWDAMAAVTRLSRVGCHTDDLIVRPFNGRLFSRASAPSLEAGRLSRAPRGTAKRDAAMRHALVALGSRSGRAGREEITYADLGVEQLGAVYERILDLDPFDLVARGPEVPPAGRPVRRQDVHSRRRKQSGTFYTPQPLAEFVVRRTLAPLVAHSGSEAILALRIVDPAMGSGAFLVAACRYLAAAYERAVIEEGRASPADLDDLERGNIRRLVAERCLAGVDANPVAVQLARLSLWLTTLALGKPLGFLDHRLRTGNSLIGAGPDDLARVPTGRRSTSSTLPLFGEADLEATLGRIARPLVDLTTRRDDRVSDVRLKEAAWRRLTSVASPLEPWRLAASLWCARWFEDAGVGPSPAELRAVIDAVLRRDRTLGERDRERWMERARALAATHRFFHWPLEFADVFYDLDGAPRARPGFDAVIGNPPWEMLRRDSTVAHDEGGGGLHPLPGRDEMGARQLLRFVRESGLYPSCDRGHLNLYQPFVERSLGLLRPHGRLGLVLPWGLASDDGAARLRERLIDRVGVDTIVGFDNSAGVFPIHRGVRFLALVAGGDRRPQEIAARFGVRTVEAIDNLPAQETGRGVPAYPVRMTPHLVRVVGGPSRRVPDVRSTSHLDLLLQLTRESPALGSDQGWGVRFGRELNATEDRASFGAHGLPVIEGKHITPFAVDATHPAARVAPAEAARLLPHLRFTRARIGYRDVSGVANRVTLIAALVPENVVTTHTVFCLRTVIDLERQYFLLGLLNSFVLNLLVRMLMGGHLTTSLVEGLPVPVWKASREERRIARLSQRLAHGSSPRVHARLQADVARLYGLSHGTLEEVLDAFPLVPVETRAAVLTDFAGAGTP